MVTVGGVTESIVDVDRFEEFARGEIRCVELGERPGVDESPFVDVRPKVALEPGDTLVRQSGRRLTEPLSVLVQVEIDRRVGVRLSITGSNTVETTARGTLDTPGLEVRPMATALATLAFAPNSHWSMNAIHGLKRCGSVGELVRISVGELVGELVRISVGELVRVSVSVLAGELVRVSVGVLAGELVRVSVGVLAGELVGELIVDRSRW